MTAKKEAVTDEQLGKVARKQWELMRRVKEGTLDADATCQEIQRVIEGISYDWVEATLFKEMSCHRRFFGWVFNLSRFEAALQRYGLEKIQEWKKLGLEIHFLPKTDMSEDIHLPGWKIKPSDNYYRRIEEGKVFLRHPDGEPAPVSVVKLDGAIVLIDTRASPELENGDQMFENDNLLGPIMKRLRDRRELFAISDECSNVPESSRFCTSSEDWEKHIKPALAEFLGVEVPQIRLERVIEANVIPQLYPHMPRKDESETCTGVLLEDYELYFGSYNRFGGNRSVVLSGSIHDSWNDRAFRPLIVLG